MRVLALATAMALGLHPAAYADPLLCPVILSHFAAVSDLEDFDIDGIADIQEERGRNDIAELLRIHRAQQQLKRAQTGNTLPGEIALLVRRRRELLRDRSLLDLAIPLPPEGSETSPFHLNRSHFHPVILGGSVPSTMPSFEISDLITQGQWALVFRRNPATFRHQGMFRVGGDLVDPHLPIESISFLSALEFANRLSLLEGREPVYDLRGLSRSGSAAEGTLVSNGGTYRISETADGYRLPNGNQWDRVQRTGSSFVEAGLNLSLPNDHTHGWFFSNSQLAVPLEGADRSRYYFGPQRTKAKAPSLLGVHDLYGNVSEWTLNHERQLPFVFGASYAEQSTLSLRRAPAVDLRPQRGIGFRLVREPRRE